MVRDVADHGLVRLFGGGEVEAAGEVPAVDLFSSARRAYDARDKMLEGRAQSPFDLFSAYASPRTRSGVARSEKSVFDRPPIGRYEPEPFEMVSRSTEAARHFERGLHHLQNGDEESALAEWELATGMDPENRAYQANLMRLRKRRGLPCP
jgi:hypothetical protein